MCHSGIGAVGRRTSRPDHRNRVRPSVSLPTGPAVGRAGRPATLRTPRCDRRSGGPTVRARGSSQGHPSVSATKSAAKAS